MTHFRQEWIEALESGRFPQAIGSFSDGEKRCAIAVGFAVLREQSVSPLRFGSLRGYYSSELLGITKRQSSLIIAMNDEYRMSHAEIARIIRQLDSREAMIAAEHDPAACEDRALLEESEGIFPRY
jgi:hypothetical protein